MNPSGLPSRPRSRILTAAGSIEWHPPRSGLVSLRYDRVGRRPPVPHPAGGDRGHVQRDLATDERRRPVSPSVRRGHGRSQGPDHREGHALHRGRLDRHGHQHARQPSAQRGLLRRQEVPGHHVRERQRVEGSGRRANVYGQLTIHGVTREIEVPVEIAVTDVALMAKGEFVINRRDYGINYRRPTSTRSAMTCASSSPSARVPAEETTMDTKRIAAKLSDASGSSVVAPVAVTFRAAAPAGVKRVARAGPAGCAYWRSASEGRVFYTEAEDHYNCPVGSHTHGVRCRPIGPRRARGRRRHHGGPSVHPHGGGP